MTSKFIHTTFMFFLMKNTILVNAQDTTTSLLHGAYLGQKPPGKEAVIFAKDIISTQSYEHSAPAFSLDRKTILWTVLEMNKPARLLEMTMKGGIWSQPHSPSFADQKHDDFYPFFSCNGKKLFFSSRRLLPSGLPVEDMNLWVVDRTQDGWGVPAPINSKVSRGVEYAHAVSKSENLYFSAREVINGKPTWKIYRAEFTDGKYTIPVPLDSNINDGSYVDGPYVSPDEKFLIFESDRPGGMGSIDLYICFRESNGNWSVPKNMGEKINSRAAERFAGLTPDGKYFFFGSKRSSTLPDVYWIDAAFIHELK